MVSALFAATTIAEIVVRIAATRAADSSGAEQQNTLLEQRSAYRSDHHDAAGLIDHLEHPEGGCRDLLAICCPWRRSLGPAMRRTLGARLHDERPEHHQRAVIVALCRRDHRAVAHSARQVQIPMGKAD
jgi:hypothetical protein